MLCRNQHVYANNIHVQKLPIDTLAELYRVIQANLSDAGEIGNRLREALF